MKKPIKNIDEALRRRRIRDMVNLLILIAAIAPFLVFVPLKNVEGELLKWAVGIILAGIWIWRFVKFTREAHKTLHYGGIYKEIR